MDHSIFATRSPLSFGTFLIVDFTVLNESARFFDSLNFEDSKITLEPLEERIRQRISAVEAVADSIPGVLIIHNLPDFRVQYMSEHGLKSLGKDRSEVEQISSKEYHDRYFNAEDAADYVPKIQNMLENNTNDIVSYFQQVRTSSTQEFDWYLSATRILMRDDENQPVLTITIAMQIDPQHHITSKVNRLLEENNFLRKHYHEFSTLTKRERDILRLLALGNSAADIGKTLYISEATAETHRRNIKRKLRAGNLYELSQYARAFDLI
jgi:DNA-binding CsgD family transcriptional regulator